MSPIPDIATYKAELLETAQSLVGQRIDKVYYWENDYGSEEFDKVDYHTLDFGISFITSSGVSYYIIWDRQCVQFDIKIKRGDIKDEFRDGSNIKTYNVTNSNKWREVINKEVIDAHVKWHSDINAPQEVFLKFENSEQIIISSAEVWEDKKVRGMSDNIIIFFNPELASKYGIS